MARVTEVVTEMTVRGDNIGCEGDSGNDSLRGDGDSGGDSVVCEGDGIDGERFRRL